MSRKARFSQADIVRAIKGFQAAGLEVGSIIIELDGTIVIVRKGYESAVQEEPDWRIGSPLYAERQEPPRAYSVRSLAEHWQCSDGARREKPANA